MNEHKIYYGAKFDRRRIKTCFTGLLAIIEIAAFTDVGVPRLARL